MDWIRPTPITDSVLDSSSVAESEPVYNPATPYADKALVRGNTTDTAHRVYESQVAANTGQSLSDPAKWVDIGATNRWRMFDEAVGSQTSAADEIEVSLDVPGRISAVALMTCQAASVQIVMTDATEGVVYDETYSMLDTTSVDSWYAYFFEEVERKADLVVLDLPPYANSNLVITLSDPGDTVLCGACIVGRLTHVGGTEYGATVGIDDYSVKSRDDYGNTTVKERAYNRRASFRAWVAKALVDRIFGQLVIYRAKPLVFIGTSEYGSSIVYGFFETFNFEYAYKRYSLFTIDIKGLT